jgi:hypothetical protein
MGLATVVALTNISSENIHAIEFETDIIEGNIKVTWSPRKIPNLPSGETCDLFPEVMVDNGDGTYSQKSAMVDFLDAVGPNYIDHVVIPLGAIRFTCQDKVKNRYQCSGKLSFVPAALMFEVDALECELIS